VNAPGLYGGTMEERLAALGRFCARQPPQPRAGVNLHLHTNESFGVFRSVTELVGQAVADGVAVLGINDHYTIAGHEEFRRACGIARIPATFSIEAVAMDREAERAGVLMNDPDNPGRVYFLGKGITRVPPDDSWAMKALERMRQAITARSREMAAKVTATFQERLGVRGIRWSEVTGLTPRGNVTERHVAKAAFVRLREVAWEGGIPLGKAAARLCVAEPPPGEDPAALQSFIRARLLKAGGSCFVEESEDAFLSVEQMRDLFLAFGSIPTYSILGNPVTSGEADVPGLLEWVESLGVLAIESITGRYTRERLREVTREVKPRWWPIFSGTEHNTPERKPLIDRFSRDPEFAPWFDDSAAVLLGHQEEVARGRPGYVDSRGRPTIADARERFEHFRRVGREVWGGIAPPEATR